ncbi:MAG TPA: NAD(P)-dependent alcohol dehydrogenase [Candidatus Binatia bacterium]
MSETMRAMVYRKYGGPERLALETVARPAPAPGQVLVRVVASSVNPVDWKMASGAIRLYMPAKFPCVPGFDLAGEVVELGPGVTAFAPGARVHARIAKPGAAAEYAVADVDQTATMPDGMSFELGAALPLAGMTALQGLRDRGGLPMTGATQRVLIVGASGGVGHLAVQIAAAAGAEVTGVCSSRNVNFVSRIGANTVIDYTRPDPYRNTGPFELVYDCVAGDPAPYLGLVKPGGRYASCMPGPKTFLRMLANPVSRRKVYPVMLKGSAADLAFLDQLFDAKKLEPAIDGRATLEELSTAWKRSMTGRATGKIIIEVAPS